MKPNNSILLSVMLTISVVLEGCLDINIRTKIASDGSSERIITVGRDSESLPSTAFPIPVDTSWSTEWKQTGKDSPKYEYTARKIFASPEELGREYSMIPDTGVLRLRVNINKSFEWFYTYINYEETYNLDNPFTKIPISSILSEDEIKNYRRGIKDDSLKARVDKWFIRNIVEDFFDDMVLCVEKKNDPSLPVSDLLGKKEIILSAATKDSGISDVDALLKLLENTLRTKAVYSLRDDLDRLWKKLEAKSERVSTADGNYTNSVELPGLILDTNSDNIEGSLVSWKFTSDQLRIGEFKMHAESRVTNIWTFIITGVLIIFAIIILFVKFRRS